MTMRIIFLIFVMFLDGKQEEEHNKEEKILVVETQSQGGNLSLFALLSLKPEKNRGTVEIKTQNAFGSHD